MLFALPNWSNEGANIIDVIGECNTAECLDKNKNYGFIIVASADVTKANGQHNISPPVVPPNVLDIPSSILDAKFNQPVSLTVDVRHEIQANW